MELRCTITPEEREALDQIEADAAATLKPKEQMFGAALPAVLRRPQRFANYDPRPDLPFEDMDDERRPMSMLVTVLYGAAWGLAIVGIVVANWGR